jgi:hypothetical protein
MSFPVICLSVEFVFVDTTTLCPDNWQRKTQSRAVISCYQCCEMRTVNPISGESLQNYSV